jgi:PEP-CTERM/exosortase A-associated glycosyltransferase
VKGLRVLHVLDHSLPLHSGYAFRTLAILREQRRLEWETLQLTSPKQGATELASEEVDGWRFFRTPSSAGTGLLQQMRLTAKRIDEIVIANAPDLIHAHSPVLNALPSLWTGRRHRLPVVYEVRASWEDAAVDHGTTTEGSLRYRASRALETFALRRADAIVTICDGLRRDIVGRGIDPDRVSVVPNAVDTTTFRFGVDADPELRRSLRLEGSTVLGFAGSFYGYEGLSLLLEATQRLLPQRDDLRVLLVGGGPEEASLRAQAAALGIADRVLFAGRIAHRDVQRYYELIDVLAYPRLATPLTERVTPLKPLEAMAQGRMFVASDVGGQRELIRDGETGVLFKAGSADALARAIETVLQQRQRWPEMLARARRHVEGERTWSRSVANYREAYDRALSRHGRRLVPAV